MKKLISFSLVLLSLQPGVYAQRSQSRSGVSCVQCCRQGRWVSDECRRSCNSCQQYADEAAAEGRNYPD